MPRINKLHVLVVIWWAGAAAAGIAILLPQYNNFLILGIVGWATLLSSSGLMLYEIRRIKREDSKKNEIA